MRIATYFQPLESMDSERERRTLDLFLSAWSSENVVVCDRTHSENHRRFNEMIQYLECIPEITPVGYREQCFLRWLAFNELATKSEPLLILDYDVFPITSNASLAWVPNSFDRPTILDNTNPCAMFLPSPGFLSAIVDMLFMETEPDIEIHGAHIGDNTVFSKHWYEIGGRSCSWPVWYPYPSNPIRKQNMMAHFSNSTIPSGIDRSEFIAQILGTILPNDATEFDSFFA